MCARFAARPGSGLAFNLGNAGPGFKTRITGIRREAQLREVSPDAPHFCTIPIAPFAKQYACGGSHACYQYRDFSLLLRCAGSAASGKCGDDHAGQGRQHVLPAGPADGRGAAHAQPGVYRRGNPPAAPDARISLGQAGTAVFRSPAAAIRIRPFSTGPQGSTGQADQKFQKGGGRSPFPRMDCGLKKPNAAQPGVSPCPMNVSLSPSMSPTRLQG